MNNEPVATCWLQREDGTRLALYTHPAKTLTDEEIMEVAEEPWLWDENGVLRSCIDFAKAILRKAQEK